MNRRRCLPQKLVEAANLRSRRREEADGSKTQRSASSTRRLQKVFFSDDGSTALEVALKLAYEFTRRTGRSKKPTEISLAGRRVSRRHRGRGRARPH